MLRFGIGTIKSTHRSNGVRLRKHIKCCSSLASIGENSGSNFTKIFGIESSVPAVSMNDASCELSLHTGRVGHFADSSVVCRYGNTVIHVAISCAKAENPTSDFLPLTVDYRNRMYAHGSFAPGSNRRERSSDEEILVSRIIDRCVRPLFPKGYVNEVQVTVTAHSVDSSNVGGDPVVASIVATSYALRMSSQPWYLTPSGGDGGVVGDADASTCHDGVIGCVRVGLVGGKMVINPTQEQVHCSDMNLLYCGTEYRPLMIEFSGNEVPEATVSEALVVAQGALSPVIQYQKALHAEDSERAAYSGTKQLKYGYLLPPALRQSAEAFGYDRAVEIFSGRSIIPATSAAGGDAEGTVLANRPPTKFERSRAEGSHMGNMLRWLEMEGSAYCETEGTNLHPVVQGMAASHVMRKAFRSVLLASGSAKATMRADGRALDELRPIECFADILPDPVHGSSIFRRGDTHVLCSTTLGSKLDGKQISPLQLQFDGASGAIASNGDPSKRSIDNFMLHYDFPPYCTGKVGNASSLDRRMVGHGYLAEKAIRSVLPPFNNFPYTVRLYAECTSSSGSSSMASVVGGCLALVDAGVPVKNLVAGASVGLVTGEEYSIFPTAETDGPTGTVGAGESNYTLITDILGSEDYYGDMDFKVAGSKEGVTAIQLDIKLPYGIPIPILSEALLRARDARLTIIDQMEASTKTKLGAVTLNVAVPPSSNSSLEANAVDASVASEGALSSLIPVKYLRCADSMKSYAPRAELITYNNAEKRKNVIGPAGEMKRYIQETYNVSLDVEEVGAAYVYGNSPDSNVTEAALLLKDLVTEISPNEVFHNVSIVEVKDFGLTVRLTRSQNALLHISELTHNAELLKLKTLSDVFEVGQVLSGSIVVMQVDNATGHVKASRKKLLSASSSDSDIFVFESPVASSALVGDTGASAHDEISMTPPRKYDKTFFSNQVVSRDDAERAGPKGVRHFSTVTAGNQTSRSRIGSGITLNRTLSSMCVTGTGIDGNEYRRVRFSGGYIEAEEEEDIDDLNVAVLPTNEFHSIVSHKVPSAVEDHIVRQAEESFIANGSGVGSGSMANSSTERAVDWGKKYSKKSVLLNDLQDIDTLLDSSLLSSLKQNENDFHSLTEEKLSDESEGLTGKVKSLFEIFSRTVNEVLAEKEPEEVVTRTVSRMKTTEQSKNDSSTIERTTSSTDDTLKENNDLYGIIAILQKQRSLLMQSDHNSNVNKDTVNPNIDGMEGLSQREYQANANKGERIKSDMLQLFSSYTHERNGSGVGSVQDKIC